MRIALVDTNKVPRYYSLPLLKISSWRKSLGDECELFTNTLPKKGEFDEIWLTTLFSFQIHHALKFVKAARSRAKRVRVGGISASLFPDYFKRLGVDVYFGLIPDAERCSPDYSLLADDPDYSITYITRGCIRKCEFCTVSTIEPKFKHRSGWVNDLHPKAKEIVFYDNNWSALNPRRLADDADIMKGLKVNGQIKTIDFNQGFDCRVMTIEKADIMTGVPLEPVKFAFDGMHEDGHYQRAVRMMAERGFSSFMAYVLYNFEDTPADFYYRLKESCRLQDELGVTVKGFPMKYQPIDISDLDRSYSGPNWSEQSKYGFQQLLYRHSPQAIVTCHSKHLFKSTVKEFEYWFGKDEDEFIKLINYPKIRLLAERKKGNLRQMRLDSKKGSM